MEFTNAQIDSLQLPSVEEIDYQRLQKGYKKVLNIQNILFYGVLILGWLIIALANSIPLWITLLVLGVLVLFLLTSFVLVHQFYIRKGYAIRERDIMYRTGWIVRRVTALPFNRVQHCEVNQGVIEKLFQLAKLEVFTAGGSSSDLKIPGLSYDMAHRLKDYILGNVVSYEEEE